MTPDALEIRSEEFDRATLEAQAAALAVLAERERAFPLYAYRPVPKLRAFHTNRARLRIVSGGNRSGKSHVGCAETGAYLLGYRPWVLREMGLPVPERPWERPENLPEDAICFNVAGIRVPIPNTCFCVTGQSYTKGIGETLYPKLRELLGPVGGPLVAKEHMSHAGAPHDVILRNGSRVVFGSAEQGNLAFESTNYTFNCIDEPIPRRVYVGISRGSIDQFAPIIMHFTPIGPWAAWIFRELYANSNLSSEQCARFNVSIYDNPYLPREAIDEWANDPTLSEMEREVRLYGHFAHLTDRIYSIFDEKIHVLPDFVPPTDGFCGVVVDPHTIKPWAVAYFYVNTMGEIFFYREWPTEEYTKLRKCRNSIDDYAALFRRLDGTHNVQLRLMDPNYGPRTDLIRGRYIPSVRDDLSRYGLHFDTGLKDDLEYGEARVRALLAWDTKSPLDSLNRPHIYFTESCHNLINAMNYYTAKLRVGTDEPDETRRDETYKDFADLVRYVAVSPLGQMAGVGALDFDQFGGGSEDDLGPTGYGEE